MLPHASEQTISEIENRVDKISNYSNMLQDKTPSEALNEIFNGLPVDFIEEVTPKYKCSCSKERLKSVIVSMGQKEIEDIIKKDGKAEIICKFCNKKYNFNKEELLSLLKKATSEENKLES
ncbi:MAG: Hsp33 family molecular chaperone HslO [Eubacteriales bacterium]